MNVSIELGRFDFDFWSNNKVKVLLVLIEKKRVDDILFLSLVTNIGYATVHRIIKEFEDRGLVFKEGRKILLCENWGSVF